MNTINMFILYTNQLRSEKTLHRGTIHNTRGEASGLAAAFEQFLAFNDHASHPPCFVLLLDFACFAWHGTAPCTCSLIHHSAPAHDVACCTGYGPTFAFLEVDSNHWFCFLDLWRQSSAMLYVLPFFPLDVLQNLSLLLQCALCRFSS